MVITGMHLERTKSWAVAARRREDDRASASMTLGPLGYVSTTPRRMFTASPQPAPRYDALLEPLTAEVAGRVDFPWHSRSPLKWRRGQEKALRWSDATVRDDCRQRYCSGD